MPYRLLFATDAKLDMRPPWLTPGEAAWVLALAPDQLRETGRVRGVEYDLSEEPEA